MKRIFIVLFIILGTLIYSIYFNYNFENIFYVLGEFSFVIALASLFIFDLIHENRFWTKNGSKNFMYYIPLIIGGVIAYSTGLTVEMSFDLDEFSLINVTLIFISQAPAFIGAIFTILLIGRSKVEQKEGFLSKDEVETFIKSIFTSERFISTLNSRLPKGEKDDEHGFDHIPYLLENIQLRRDRFSIIAQRYLSITLTLGITFLMVILMFSYVILNDSSIGDGRTINQINGNLNEINSSLNSDFQLEFNNTYAEEIDDFFAMDCCKEERADSIYQEFVTAFENQRFDNISNLKILFDSYLTNSEFRLAADEQFIKVALDIQKGINDAFIRENELPAQSARLDELITTIENNYSQEGRIPDLIKRVSIMLAVASFFIAILRYTAKIYTENQNQVYIAERDDLAVRQFYVALKSAKEDKDQISVVLREFMKIRGASVFGTKSENADNLNADQMKAISALVNTIVKRVR